MKRHFGMVVILAAALVLGGIRAFPQANRSQASQDHNIWLGEQLKQLESIRPGMTRIEIERFTRQDGGLFRPPEFRYVSRECDLCKVTITFRMTGDADRDVVEKVSKPFLETPFFD